MEETMKINYHPTDGDADMVVAFIDQCVNYILKMHYKNGFYPSFINDYMRQNGQMSFIECAETPFDDMNEDSHAETSLEEEFVPATPSLIGGTVETVGDWIKEYISKEVIDNIYDDHSCWITIFNQYDLPSLRGLLAKIDMRMMLKMLETESRPSARVLFQLVSNFSTLTTKPFCAFQL